MKQSNLDKMGIALSPLSTKMKITMLVSLHKMTETEAKEYLLK